MAACKPGNKARKMMKCWDFVANHSMHCERCMPVVFCTGIVGTNWLCLLCLYLLACGTVLWAILAQSVNVSFGGGDSCCQPVSFDTLLKAKFTIPDQQLWDIDKSLIDAMQNVSKLSLLIAVLCEKVKHILFWHVNWLTMHTQWLGIFSAVLYYNIETLESQWLTFLNLLAALLKANLQACGMSGCGAVTHRCWCISGRLQRFLPG